MSDATDVKVMTLDAYQAGTEAIVDNLIPTDVSTTLIATNWVTTTSGGKTIHTYPLSISIAGKYRTVICSLSPNATVAQSSTMAQAKIESISYDSEDEVLSIVAAGTKPATDIPVVIQLATVNSVAEAPKYVEGANVPIASTTVLGIVRIDGTSITIDQNGVISADSGHTILDEAEVIDENNNAILDIAEIIENLEERISALEGRG